MYRVTCAECAKTYDSPIKPHPSRPFLCSDECRRTYTNRYHRTYQQRLRDEKRAAREQAA